MNAGLNTPRGRAAAGTAAAALFFWALATRDVTGQILPLTADTQALTALDLEASAAGRESLAGRCAGREIESDPILAAITAALSLDDDGKAKAALIEAEDGVRAAALASPEDVEAQYRLAALLGARAEREGGRTKISVAKEVATQAQRVVDLEPAHAGGNYLLGRLHAAVMRLGRLTRFLATRVLGGGALKQASWEEAQSRLVAAEMLDPCEPDHHYELARLFGERQQREDAERELSHVHELTDGHAGRWAAVRAKAERLPSGWKKEGR